MGKKPRIDTRARPKTCLSGPSDGQGPWGGHQHGWSHAQHTQLKFSSEFEQFLPVSILLNALFGPGRTNGQTDRRTCLNGSNPQVNAKCDVVMKLSVFGTRTDRHTHTHTHTHTRKAKPMHLHYATRATISQDYWGGIKEYWGSGGRKSPSGVQGRKSPRSLILFALKYNKQ